MLDYLVSQIGKENIIDKSVVTMNVFQISLWRNKNYMVDWSKCISEEHINEWGKMGIYIKNTV